MLRNPASGLVALLLFGLFSAAPTGAQTAQGILVLPFEPIEVSAATGVIVSDLLAGELEAQGRAVLETRSPDLPSLPQGETACNAVACARELGKRHGAGLVVFGSVTRLGEKRILRAHALRMDEELPFYNDQLTAVTEGDIEGVLHRIAESIAAGLPNSGRATVTSVIQAEARPVLQRSSRRGLGLRGAFLFPTGGGYGDVDRLSGFKICYKWERPHHFVEATTLTELLWGSGQVDWTVFSVYTGYIFAITDWAPYVGGGLGIHTLRLERKQKYEAQSGQYQYVTTDDQGATSLAIEFGAGAIAMRTYDFELTVALHYRYVFEEFEQIGGHGAQGIYFGFGVNR